MQVAKREKRKKKFKEAGKLRASENKFNNKIENRENAEFNTFCRFNKPRFVYTGENLIFNFCVLLQMHL